MIEIEHWKMGVFTMASTDTDTTRIDPSPKFYFLWAADYQLGGVTSSVRMETYSYF